MRLSKCFEEHYPRLSAEQAFQHYEHVRARLPVARFANEHQSANGLVAIAAQFDVFVFDAYGVLNVGHTPIATASECVAELRALGKQVFVLTNGASYNAAANIAKFNGLGFDFTAAEIVASRVAAERIVAEFGNEILWGAVAKADYCSDEIAQPTLKLNDDRSDYDRVTGFLLLSMRDWTIGRQKMLEQSYENNPRPVIVANPDIVSPREDHFGLEPGYIGHRLIEKYQAEVQFHGKPFPSVFDIVEERLGGTVLPDRICMVGDTLHTDILGAAAHGWKSVLVSGHGMFKGLDVDSYIKRSAIVPDWVVETI
ncbi:MAG: HAD-IIA family hydrolase [Rhizobiaceae bacterium]|nr:HAD-IIA family hydrolase [Rhizobiaceae bacterium]